MAPSSRSSRLALALAGAAAVAASAADAAAPPPPLCHAPWGNEQALESPCFTSVYANGDVSVRQYTPKGPGYQQAFLETYFPGGGDPTAYEAHILTGVFDLLLYFVGENVGGTKVRVCDGRQQLLSVAVVRTSDRPLKQLKQLRSGWRCDAVPSASRRALKLLLPD